MASSYESMKKTNMPEIGNIPTDWNLIKLKFFSEIYGRIGFRGYTASDLVDEGEGAITLGPPNIDNQKLNLDNKKYLSWEKYDESPEIKIYNGDLLLVKTASVGKVALVENLNYPTTLNPQLTVFKNIQINNKYFYYTMISDVIQYQIALNVNGGVISTLSQENIQNYIIPLPSPNEQQQIANYLDKQTAKIDDTIAKNDELIQLLEEKRIALINQVVTKGLISDCPMKDSGVEWIGEMPEHWEINKIKKYFYIYNGSTPKNNEENWNGNIHWITPADYKTTDIYINNSSRKITKAGLNSCGTTLVPKGSIIVSNRAPIGTVAIANVDLCTNQGCKSLAIKRNINTKFVYYVLSINEKELNKLGRGTTFMELSAYDLGTFPIPIAPDSEQKDIVNYLDKETSKINQI